MVDKANVAFCDDLPTVQHAEKEGYAETGSCRMMKELEFRVLFQPLRTPTSDAL